MTRGHFMFRISLVFFVQEVFLPGAEISTEISSSAKQTDHVIVFGKRKRMKQLHFWKDGVFFDSLWQTQETRRGCEGGC